MTINPSLYQVFYTVASSDSMTAAASKLYISQPAISKSIRNLESQLNVTLFHRKSHGVQLTKEGQVLYDYVHRAMSLLTEGELRLQNMSQENTIKVGVSSSMCRFFLLPYLNGFQKDYPQIALQIINASTQEIIQGINRGSIHIGINCFPQETQGYKTIKLFDIHDIFIANRNYPLNKKVYTPKDLTQHPLLLTHPNSIARQSISSYFQKHGLSVTPHMETENMAFLIDYVKSSTAIACVIEEFVQDELEEGLFVKVPLALAPPVREAGILHSEELPLSWASRALIDYILGSNKTLSKKS